MCTGVGAGAGSGRISGSGELIVRPDLEFGRSSEWPELGFSRISYSAGAFAEVYTGLRFAAGPSQNDSGGFGDTKVIGNRQ